MGTTTKMAIPYPEATGLVKDGWEDMKDIATQVDAKSGLILIKTYSLSAVTSWSADNNTFSSSFDDYMLLVDVSLSASAETRMRLRTGGTDATGANYDYYSNAFTTTFNNQAGASGQTSAYINGSSNKMSFQFFVYDPFNATDTRFNSYGNISTTNTIASSGYHGLSTSYDSITIYRSSGTMTGAISVFGVNK